MAYVPSRDTSDAEDNADGHSENGNEGIESELRPGCALQTVG